MIQYTHIYNVGTVPSIFFFLHAALTQLFCKLVCIKVQRFFFLNIYIPEHLSGVISLFCVCLLVMFGLYLFLLSKLQYSAISPK